MNNIIKVIIFVVIAVGFFYVWLYWYNIKPFYYLGLPVKISDGYEPPKLQLPGNHMGYTNRSVTDAKTTLNEEVINGQNKLFISDDRGERELVLQNGEHASINENSAYIYGDYIFLQTLVELNLYISIYNKNTGQSRKFNPVCDGSNVIGPISYSEGTIYWVQNKE